MGETSNVVLVGDPGAGKSHLGDRPGASFGAEKTPGGAETRPRRVAQLLAGAFERFGYRSSPVKSLHCLLGGHGHRGLHIADTAARHGDKNT